MATKNIFITGNTDLLILSILKKEDTYAYDIAKQINAFSRGYLNLSNNTIYTATYKLENNGYISEYSRQVGKKTDTGILSSGKRRRTLSSGII